jgi:hypothetical protein
MTVGVCTLQVGDRFNRLTIVERVPRPANSKRQAVYWECRCDCGNTVALYSHLLTSGHTKSCGCLYREGSRARALKHGRRHSPEYNSWANMLSRCTNVNNPVFAHYGGRGIAVCDEWRTSFEEFFADMGPKPTPAHSLERIDVDRNYEPTNCRWATRKEQNENKRNSLFLVFRGERLVIAQVAKQLDIDRTTLTRYMRRNGWPELTGEEDSLKELIRRHHDLREAKKAKLPRQRAKQQRKLAQA